MTAKGERYSMNLFLDQESGGYVAVSPELPDISAFGETREDAIRELGVAVELALEAYGEEGWPLPAPEPAPDPMMPSGEFRLRIPRRMHAQLARRAKQEGVSQNFLVGMYVAHGLASVGVESFGTAMEPYRSPSVAITENRTLGIILPKGDR